MHILADFLGNIGANILRNFLHRVNASFLRNFGALWNFDGLGNFDRNFCADIFGFIFTNLCPVSSWVRNATLYGKNVQSVLGFIHNVCLEEFYSFCNINIS